MSLAEITRYLQEIDRQEAIERSLRTNSQHLATAAASVGKKAAAALKQLQDELRKKAKFSSLKIVHLDPASVAAEFGVKTS